jgi:hypothetical protein
MKHSTATVKQVAIKWLVIGTMLAVPLAGAVADWAENRPQPAHVTLSEPEPESTITLTEQQVEPADANPVLSFEQLTVVARSRIPERHARDHRQRCFLHQLVQGSGSVVVCQ